VGRSRALALAAALAVVLAAPGAAAQAAVLGTWATEGGKSHVEITPCEPDAAKLCGVIVWLKEPLDDAGAPKRDRNNPDAALRERPILGLPLLAGFAAGGEPDVWEGGRIYNPEDGETYRCTMTLLGDGRLEVRGYVGLPLFGKSQVWTRVAPG
jgi:uncharacterized protein (DUF2147 family)